MTDRFDIRIRRLVEAVAASAPAPPDAPDRWRLARRRRIQRGIHGGLALALTLVVASVTVWAMSARPDPIGSTTPQTMTFTVIAPIVPARLVAQVRGVPGVADATWEIVEPAAEPGAGLTTTVVVPIGPDPAGDPPSSGRALMTVTVTLRPGTDPMQVAAGILDTVGIVAIDLPVATAIDLQEAWFVAAREGATALGGDPPVIRPAPGPEPAFDTSGLGMAVPLIPATSARGWPAGGGWCGPPGADPSQPSVVVAIGSTPAAGTQISIVDGTSPCLIVRDAGGWSSGSFDFSRYPISRIIVAAMSSLHSGTLVARVPATAAVAVARIDGAPAIWQRPVVGIAAFDVPAGSYSQVVIDFYDADGLSIGRIEERYPTGRKTWGGADLADPPFVWMGSGAAPEEVAIEFARFVLGWTTPVATMGTAADRSGPVWVSLSQPGSTATIEVLTAPAGDRRGVLQVATPGTGGAWVEVGDAAVVHVRIAPVAGAVAAMAVARADDGTQVAVTTDLMAAAVVGGAIDLGPMGLARGEDLATLLVLYLDPDGTVVAAVGNSFGG